MLFFHSKILAKKWFKKVFLFAVFITSVLLIHSVLKPAYAATGIRKTINFQGKVVNSDGTNVTDGDYDFTFAIYTVDTAGSAIWTEARTGVNQVTVTDGVFRVELGEITSLPGSVDFNTDNIYLGINFNSDGEMSPRVRFTSVPYAFNAETVSGLTVTDTTGTLTIPDGTTIAFSGTNNTTFTTTAATNVTLPTTGTLATLAGTETLNNKTIGTAGLTFVGATTDITTGTNEDFVLSPNGTGKIGFGTVSPTAFVDIEGDLRVFGSATVSASYAEGVALVVKAATGQTANLTEWQNSSGTATTVVDANGFIDFSNSATPVSWNNVLKINSWNVGTSEVTGGFGYGFIKNNSNGRAFLNLVTDNGTNSLLSGGIDAEGYRRFALTGSGTWQVGGGSATYDTILERLTGGGWQVSTTGSNAPLTVSGNIGVGVYPGGEIFHNGDTDTKLDFGNNKLRLQAGGTPGIQLEATIFSGNWANQTNMDFSWDGDINDGVLFVDTSTENVGIGSTSPGYLLDIARSSNGLEGFRASNLNTGTNAVAAFGVETSTLDGGVFAFSGSYDGGFGLTNLQDRLVLGTGSVNSGDGVSIVAAGSGDINFYTGGYGSSYERFRIDSAGNIGIGTTTTSFLVDARRNQNSTTGIRVFNSTNDTLAMAGYLFGNTNRGGSFGIIADNFTGGAGLTHFAGRMGMMGDAGATAPLGIDIVSTHTSGDVRFYTGGILTSNERLRIDSAGNVGIGSVSPGYKLDLVGEFNLTDAIRVAGDAGISGYLLTSSAGGAMTWTDPSSLTGGTGLWTNTLNVFHPKNEYAGVVDLTIGGNSTSSANIILGSNGTITALGAVLGSSIDRSTSGALTIGNTTATSVSICNSAACDTITIGNNADADSITIGDSLDGLTIASTGFNASSGGALSGISTLSSSGDWTWSATTPTITINSGESLTISDGTSSFTFDTATGPSYVGTARPARKIVLSPEYSGGTLSAFYGAGTETATTGTMTADIETTAADNLQTYYEWTSAETTLQSYTVAVRIQLPPDFSDWATSNALQIQYTTESTTNTNSALDVYTYLSSDSTTAVASDLDNAAAVAETWESVTIDDSVLNDASAPEWDAAGETQIIYLRMKSKDNNFVRIGDIILNYVSSY